MKHFLLTVLLVGSTYLHGSQEIIYNSFKMNTRIDTPIKDCAFLTKTLQDGALDSVFIEFAVYIVDYKNTFWEDNDSISIYLDGHNVFNGRVWHIARNKNGGWLSMIYHRNKEALFFNISVVNHTLGKTIETRSAFLFSIIEVYYPSDIRKVEMSQLYITSPYGRLPEQYWKWGCFD